MLIECPECKHSISDKARTCPQCGHPMVGSGDPVMDLMVRNLEISRGIFIILLVCSAVWTLSYYAQSSFTAPPIPGLFFIGFCVLAISLIQMQLSRIKNF